MDGIAKYIEHTILKPGVTPQEIAAACAEVGKYGFLGICVNSGQIALAADALRGSGAKIVSTCAFPLGAVPAAVKVYEACLAVEAGADEKDMVMNQSAAKSGDWQAVTEDIGALVKAAGVPVKVIIETALLTYDEKALACKAVIEGGAQCVKTCTGGIMGGAKENDVELLKSLAGGKIKIKASGGIRTRTQALRLLKAGADYIGTSAGPIFVMKHDG
ncbi:MAG: deoxyribose-phosphate aldolase [Acidaminococcales bacterium]|nr:deoxyribose-phosphate aldolase [Acidaminococcales bacterium]